MQSWQDCIKDKKVAFFVAETVPSVAGFGLNAFHFASAISQYGCNSTIICYNYNDKLPAREVIEHINIRRITYFNNNLLTKIISLPRLIFNYYKQVKENDIVFIYGKYLVGYELILFFSIAFNRISIFRSTLLNDDDIDSIKKQSRILWPFRKYLFSKIFCYWAINKSFANIWKDHSIINPAIFESSQGVNTIVFHPQHLKNIEIRKQLQIPVNSIIFLSCGLLIERKGYRDIFKVLSNITYPYIYVIAGLFSESPEHKSSKSEIEEMESLYKYGSDLLHDKVRFIGTTGDVVSYYNSCDYFIHGAYNEGTPNVILEAMATGIPIICRKLESLSGELLKNNINCKEFSDKVELENILSGLPNRRNEFQNLAKSALNTIQENYTFEAVIERLFICLKKKDL